MPWPLPIVIFCPRRGGACRAPGLARGLDAMHPDRMHMQRHDTSHQGQQGQSDAPVAGRCAHHPIIRPSAPVAGMAELDRPQLVLGWDRGPFPAQRTSISATTDLNRQIVYVAARASPTFLNSPSLEPPRWGGPGPRTNAAALSFSSLRCNLPSKTHQKITLSKRNTVAAENREGDRDMEAPSKTWCC